MKAYYSVGLLATYTKAGGKFLHSHHILHTSKWHAIFFLSERKYWNWTNFPPGRSIFFASERISWTNSLSKLPNGRHENIISTEPSGTYSDALRTSSGIIWRLGAWSFSRYGRNVFSNSKACIWHSLLQALMISFVTAHVPDQNSRIQFASWIHDIRTIFLPRYRELGTKEPTCLGLSRNKERNFVRDIQ